jgi:hypothetical protein
MEMMPSVRFLFMSFSQIPPTRHNFEQAKIPSFMDQNDSPVSLMKVFMGIILGRRVRVNVLNLSVFIIFRIQYFIKKIKIIYTKPTGSGLDAFFLS